MGLFIFNQRSYRMYKLNLLALVFLMSGCGATPKRVEVVEEDISVVEAPQATKSMGNLIVLETADQLASLISDSKIILVDLFAPWCGPCRSFLDVLAKVAPEFPNVTFVKVNVDTFPTLSSQYNVSSLPTIKVFTKGDGTKSVKQWTGGKSASELRKILKELGA